MKRIYKLLLSAMIIATASSCEKLADFGDINVNPGATTSPNIGALLTNVQAGLAGFASQQTPGYFAQYFSETQYSSASLYAIPQVDFTGTYSGSLYDLQNIINSGESKSTAAVAKIMQQYIFWTLTDRWGDIPYSEALKGAGSTRPKYDKQEDIYKGMIQALKDANGMFDGSAIKGDIIYGGNADAWKRTANTIRMMMALQLSKRFPKAGEYAATEFNAALKDGVITSNAQNFSVKFPGGNFASPWWNTYNGRKDIAQSNTMTGLLGALNDGRQNAYGGATELQGEANTGTSSNVGVPYGVAREKAEAFTSNNPTWARVLRGDLRAADAVTPILTAAHATLARAEAADYGWTTENVKSLYESGIKLSFEQWGLAAPAASYFTQAAVALTGAGGTGANLKQIATQRFIAHYPDGLQGWNIWRKTGFPVLTPAPDAVNASKQIPRRYIYATAEYSTNKESVEAAVGRVTNYNQDARVWWDQ